MHLARFGVELHGAAARSWKAGGACSTEPTRAGLVLRRSVQIRGLEAIRSRSWQPQSQNEDLADRAQGGYKRLALVLSYMRVQHTDAITASEFQLGVVSASQYDRFPRASASQLFHSTVPTRRTVTTGD
jgi:hypothetical protein